MQRSLTASPPPTQPSHAADVSLTQAATAGQVDASVSDSFAAARVVSLHGLELPAAAGGAGIGDAGDGTVDHEGLRWLEVMAKRVVDAAAALPLPSPARSLDTAAVQPSMSALFHAKLSDEREGRVLRRRRRGNRAKKSSRGGAASASEMGADSKTVSLRLHITQTESSRARCVEKPQPVQKKLLAPAASTLRPWPRPRCTKAKATKAKARAKETNKALPLRAAFSAAVAAAAAATTTSAAAVSLLPRRTQCLHWNAPQRGGISSEDLAPRVVWEPSPAACIGTPPLDAEPPSMLRKGKLKKKRKNRRQQKHQRQRQTKTNAQDNDAAAAASAAGVLDLDLSGVTTTTVPAESAARDDLLCTPPRLMRQTEWI